MPRLLQRYATPAITGLFLVSLISGTALFLGVGQGLFHATPEVLSFLLIVPLGSTSGRTGAPSRIASAACR